MPTVWLPLPSRQACPGICPARYGRAVSWVHNQGGSDHYPSKNVWPDGTQDGEAYRGTPRLFPAYCRVPAMWLRVSQHRVVPECRESTSQSDDATGTLRRPTHSKPSPRRLVACTVCASPQVAARADYWPPEEDVAVGITWPLRCRTHRIRSTYNNALATDKSATAPTPLPSTVAPTATPTTRASTAAIS